MTTGLRRIAVAAVATAALCGAGCGEDTPSRPAPGGTLTPTSDVRAPNGTNMGAPPPNVGTSP